MLELDDDIDAGPGRPGGSSPAGWAGVAGHACPWSRAPPGRVPRRLGPASRHGDSRCSLGLRRWPTFRGWAASWWAPLRPLRPHRHSGLRRRQHARLRSPGPRCGWRPTGWAALDRARYGPHRRASHNLGPHVVDEHDAGAEPGRPAKVLCAVQGTGALVPLVTPTTTSPLHPTARASVRHEAPPVGHVAPRPRGSRSSRLARSGLLQTGARALGLPALRCSTDSLQPASWVPAGS